MFLLKALKKHEEETEQLAVDSSKNTQSSKSLAPPKANGIIIVDINMNTT